MQTQKSAVNNLSAFITQKWTLDIEETVKDLVDAHGKKWNCSSSREDYEKSKLKPFLVVVKYMMQDSLLKIVKRSLTKFVESILARNPDSVEIVSSIKVDNIFSKLNKSDVDAQEIPLPL